MKTNALGWITTLALTSSALTLSAQAAPHEGHRTLNRTHETSNLNPSFRGYSDSAASTATLAGPIPDVPFGSADILLWNDTSSDQDIALQALELLGLDYDEVDDASALSAISGGHYSLIIVDKPASFVESDVEQSLVKYVQAHGSLLLSHWDLDELPTLAQALEVQTVFEYELPPVIRSTSRAHPIWKGVPSLLTGTEGMWIDDGDALKPLGDANVVASGPHGAAIVIGNDGRTITDGFLLTDYWDDVDGDGVIDMVELVANEIRYLLR